MAMSFGQKVKLIRTYIGISQQELANRLGIERSLLSYFENDKMDFKPDRISMIEEALGVDNLDLSIETLLAQSAKKNAELALAA